MTEALRLFPATDTGDALGASLQPSGATFQVDVCGEPLTLPGRIYVDVEALRATSLGIDPVFIDAVLTRHHSGHVRAAALARLMAAEPDWAPAYVVPLVGEYVVEIIEQVEAALTEAHGRAYGAFVRANPEFMALTAQRVVSYWDCYWRGRWRREEYPGARVLARLMAF